MGKTKEEFIPQKSIKKTMTTTAPCQSPTMHLSPKSQRVSFSSNEAPGTSPRSTQGEQEVRHRGRNGEEPSSCDKHGADEEDGLQQDETKGKSRLHRCCERDTSKKDTSAPDSSCWDLCCGFCSLWKVKKWKDLCSFLSVENHLGKLSTSDTSTERQNYFILSNA